MKSLATHIAVQIVPIPSGVTLPLDARFFRITNGAICMRITALIQVAKGGAKQRTVALPHGKIGGGEARCAGAKTVRATGRLPATSPDQPNLHAFCFYWLVKLVARNRLRPTCHRPRPPSAAGHPRPTLVA
jgi:hypothetical protein